MKSEAPATRTLDQAFAHLRLRSATMSQPIRVLIDWRFVLGPHLAVMLRRFVRMRFHTVRRSN